MESNLRSRASSRGLAELHINVESSSSSDDDDAGSDSSELTAPGLWLGNGGDSVQHLTSNEGGAPEGAPAGWAAAALAAVTLHPQPPPHRYTDGAERGWDEAWKATTLASFLPDYLLAELVDDPETGRCWQGQPRRRRMTAAVAMVDLCGFTRLAERLKSEHCSFRSSSIDESAIAAAAAGAAATNSGQAAPSLHASLPRRRLERLKSFDGILQPPPQLPPPPPLPAAASHRRGHSFDLSDALAARAKDDMAAYSSGGPTPPLPPPAGRLPVVMRQRSGSVPWDILEAQRQEGAVRAGTEELHAVVGQLFGALIAHIGECGGDVVRLAGDAIIVLFPVGGPGGSSGCFDGDSDSDAESSDVGGGGGWGSSDPFLCGRRNLTGFDEEEEEKEADDGHVEGLRRDNTTFSCCRDSTMGGAALQAVAAALEAVRLFNGAVYHGEETRIRIGVATGAVEALVVGSSIHGWQSVVAGAPLAELSTLLDDGSAGDVVVTPGCWQTVGGSAAHKLGWQTQKLPSGNLKVEINPEVNTDAAAARAAEEALEEAMPGGGMEQRRLRLARMTAGGPSQLATLRLFVPQCVLYSCEAEGSGWFASIQRLSVVFAKVGAAGLSGGGGGSGGNGLERTQAAFAALQGATVRYHGVVKELTVDDKGLIFVAAFGLPPSIGDNHPEQAVLAAVAMSEAPGAAATVGVSTGTAFTASVGAERRELAIFGDAINVAARLMARRFLRGKDAADASKVGPVLVDEATAELAAPALRFEVACKVHVKGRNQEVTAYAPAGRGISIAAFPRTPAHAGSSAASRAAAMVAAAAAATGAAVSVTPSAPAVVGRTEESEAVTRRVVQLATGRGGGLVVLDGVPGSGRRSLLRVLGDAWREGAPAVVILGGGEDCDDGSGAAPGARCPVTGPACVGGCGGSAFGPGRNSSSSGSSRQPPMRSTTPHWALASWRPVVIGALLQLREDVMAFAGWCEAAASLPRSDSLSPPPQPSAVSWRNGVMAAVEKMGRSGSSMAAAAVAAEQLHADRSVVAAAAAVAERMGRAGSAVVTMAAGRAASRRMARGRSRGATFDETSPLRLLPAAQPSLAGAEDSLDLSGSFDFRGAWGESRSGRLDSLEAVPGQRYTVFHPEWEYAFLGGEEDDAAARGHFVHFFFEAFLPEDFSSYWALARFLGTEMPGCYHGNLFASAWEALPAAGSSEAADALVAAISAVVGVLVERCKPKIVLLLDDAVAQEEAASVRLLEELVLRYSSSLLAVVASPPLPLSAVLHGGSGGGGHGQGHSAAPRSLLPPMFADGRARERELARVAVEAFQERRDPVLRARNRLRAWLVRVVTARRLRPPPRFRTGGGGGGSDRSHAASGGSGANGGSSLGSSQHGLLRAAAAVVVAAAGGLGNGKVAGSGVQEHHHDRPRHTSDPSGALAPYWSSRGAANGSGSVSNGGVSMLTPTAGAGSSTSTLLVPSSSHHSLSHSQAPSTRHRRRRMSLGAVALHSSMSSAVSSRAPSVGGSLPATPRRASLPATPQHGVAGGGGIGAMVAGRQNVYMGLPSTETLARAVGRLHRRLGNACQVVSLGPLSPEDTALLCAAGLGATRVAKEVADAVYERSGGHPSVALAFCRFLRDQGLGKLHPGGSACGGGTIWSPTPGVSLRKVLSKEVRPVQAKAVGFLNLMSCQQQWLLKVLSCFGQNEVALSALESVFPLPLDGRRSLEEDAGVLESCHVLKRQPVEVPAVATVGLGGCGVGWSEDWTLSFESPFMQQVVLSLVPAAKRRELEAAVEDQRRRRARRRQRLNQAQAQDQEQEPDGKNGTHGGGNSSSGGGNSSGGGCSSDNGGGGGLIGVGAPGSKGGVGGGGGGSGSLPQITAAMGTPRASAAPYSTVKGRRGLERLEWRKGVPQNSGLRQSG